DPDAHAVGERDGITNILLAVRACEERLTLFDDRHQRFQHPVDLPVRASRFGVRARVLEKASQTIELAFALLLHVLIRPFRLRRSETAEAAAAPPGPDLGR